MSVRYLVGDVMEVLRSMPDASVDLVLSSPPRDPFLALRSYLPSDHPDKAKEIGSEPTPGAFIDTLLDVVEECRRVLAPHGSLCFELGDTYAGSGGAGGDYGDQGLREGQPKFIGSNGRRNRPADVAAGLLAPTKRPGPEGRDRMNGWPLDKSLCLVPELLRIAMVYGVNPLTGRATPRWRARNVVRWCRPNPPVGALGDKVRPATSDILVACVDRKRYFDLDAVRLPFTGTAAKGEYNGSKSASRTRVDGSKAFSGLEHRVNTHDGAPPLDHWWFDEDTFGQDTFDQDAWHVSTEPYRGSHYATWPTDLCVRPILAMCPPRVCTTCGKASERIVDVSYERNGGGTTGARRNLAEPDGRTNGTGMTAKPTMAKVSETTGWTTCGHATWRQGVVLDSFAGSGTTLLVAHGHGRSAVGIDLDARHAALARERVGMWLEVEHHKPAEATA